MLGIVLWCDGSKRQALIWCEDHDDLAWYDGQSWPDPMTPLRSGDLVHVVLCPARGLRRARRVRLMARGVHPDLPHRLSREVTG